MTIDAVAVPGGEGRIGMLACPGTGSGFAVTPERLAADLDALAGWGARLLITLNEHQELEYLGLQDLSRWVRERGIEHLHLPVRDMSVPGRDFERRWRELGPAVRARLAAGERIAVHCWAGLGRSGMLAARLLVELGSAPQAAIEAVRAARPGAIQTLEQEEHVRRIRPLSAR